MTDAESELTILALNSGSSSLKFGLYRVGSARTEGLLSGAAESIGDKEGKFFAQDLRNNASVSETISNSQPTGRFKGDVVWCLINDRGSAQGVGG